MRVYDLYRLIAAFNNEAQIFVQSMETAKKSTVIQLVVIPLATEDEPKRNEVVLQY